MESKQATRSASNCNIDHPASAISKEWPKFAKRLAAALQSLKEDQALIISKKNSNDFVQFMGQGAFGLRMETVSNHYRNENDQLSSAEIESLKKLGWNLPTTTSDVADPDGGTNFFIDAALPVDYDKLAAMAIDTFTQVLGCNHPGFLEYKSFDFGGSSVALPELGLKAEFESGANADISDNLLKTVREFTSIPDLEFDEDRDIGVNYGPLMIYIRICQDRPAIRFFAELLTDVEESVEILKKVNVLNYACGFMHLVVMDNAVLATSETLVAPFVANHLAHALSNFCQVAGEFYEQLQAEFCDAPAPVMH